MVGVILLHESRAAIRLRPLQEPVYGRCDIFAIGEKGSPLKGLLQMAGVVLFHAVHPFLNGRGDQEQQDAGSDQGIEPECVTRVC